LSALLAALLASGCASSSKEAADRLKPKDVAFREWTLKELRDELVSRQKKMKALKGNVSTEWSSRVVPGGKQSMTGVFAVELPAKIRMSIGKPMTSIQIDLVSDGDRFWMVNHAQKTVYTGKCESLIGVENDRIPVRPMDIVEPFFVRELTDQAPFTRRLTFYETIGNYYIISVLCPDYSNMLYSKIWVDRFTSNVVRHQLYESQKGTIRVDALFDDFQTVGDLSVPHKMVINWPNQLSTLDVKFKALYANPTWDNPKIFVFDSTKPDYAFVDLDESAKMEQFGPRERRPGAAPMPGYPPPPGSTPQTQVPPAYPAAPPGDRRSAAPAPAEGTTDYVPPPNPYGARKPRPRPAE
jgi:outer membrane lipoprotein-sorting protein